MCNREAGPSQRTGSDLYVTDLPTALLLSVVASWLRRHHDSMMIISNDDFPSADTPEKPAAH